MREDSTKTNTEFLHLCGPWQIQPEFCLSAAKVCFCPLCAAPLSSRSIWRGTAKSYSTKDDLMQPPISLHPIFQYFHGLKITNLQSILLAWAFRCGLINSAQWRRGEPFSVCDVAWKQSSTFVRPPTCPKKPRWPGLALYRASSEFPIQGMITPPGFDYKWLILLDKPQMIWTD